MVFPGEDEAFIFARGDTKGKRYYLRIFDIDRKKPFVKALGSADRVRALGKARTILSGG